MLIGKSKVCTRGLALIVLVVFSLFAFPTIAGAQNASAPRKVTSPVNGLKQNPQIMRLVREALFHADHVVSATTEKTSTGRRRAS